MVEVLLGLVNHLSLLPDSFFLLADGIVIFAYFLFDLESFDFFAHVFELVFHTVLLSEDRIAMLIYVSFSRIHQLWSLQLIDLCDDMCDYMGNVVTFPRITSLHILLFWCKISQKRLLHPQRLVLLQVIR